MDKLLCGLIYIIMASLIGWFIWYRNEGKADIQDVLEEWFGQKTGIPSDEMRGDYENWWSELSEDEREEVIHTTRSPGGGDEEES